MLFSRILSPTSLVGLLVLTICGSLGFKPAMAASLPLNQPFTSSSDGKPQLDLISFFPGGDRTVAQNPDALVAYLPNSVRQAVLQDAWQRTDARRDSIRIISAQQRTWPNGCLGLDEPGTMCTMMLVSGWQVTVSTPDQRLIYRTNGSGSLVKLDPASSGMIPSPMPPQANLRPAIARAVRQDLSERTNLPISALRIVQAERRTWSDSCLGLGTAVESCAQVLVPGWRVVVENRGRRWVYRTDASGSEVRLDLAASQPGSSSLEPVPMTPDELPPPLQRRAAFRAITSGGIAGRTEQITLFNDGRIVRARLRPNGTVQSRQVDQVSLGTVRRFNQLLDQQQFRQFDQLSYRPPAGAADYFTVTFTSPEGTVQFADLVQPQLPRDLQQVIQAWNGLVNMP